MATPDEIRAITGQDPDEKPRPLKDSPALKELEALDRRLNDHVAGQRRPNETHAQAMDRVLTESPDLYAATKRARADIIRKGGIGDAASGGV